MSERNWIIEVTRRGQLMFDPPDLKTTGSAGCNEEEEKRGCAHYMQEVSTQTNARLDRYP